MSLRRSARAAALAAALLPNASIPASAAPSASATATVTVARDTSGGAFRAVGIEAGIPAPGDTAAAPGDSVRATAMRFEAKEVVAGGDGEAGRLVMPAGVAVDDFGRMYVTDAALHRLQRYDASGAFLGGSGALGSDAGRMRRPGAVGLLGTLDVAVLDRENRRVLSYDLFGRLQGVLVDLRADDLDRRVGRVDPVSLACDRGGAVYVADADRDRILAFDFSGAFLREIGGYGAQPGSFRGIRGVAAGRRGEIVTTERGGARVQRLDSAGRVVATWPLPVRDGREALPVAVDGEGRVAVADEREGRMWLFSSSGVLLAETEGLAGPIALAFDRSGTLLVAEGAAGRLRRFAVAGAGADRD